MKLGYVILYVRDVESTIGFYETAFGMECRFRHSAEGNDYAEMETGQTVLAFASETLADSHEFDYAKVRPDRSPPAIEIALVTDDVEAAYERAIQGGAVVVRPPADKPWGQTISYVKDANGFLIEICSPVGG
ncbi:VOC family protein [Crateriforma spongiae]|uniref:VOC family protein n=1 Tax=Crateriforma spongiae TaxID=2724528 RepID=UPI0039B0AB0E